MMEFIQMTHTFFGPVRLWMSGGWKQNWKFSCKRQVFDAGESTVLLFIFCMRKINIFKWFQFKFDAVSHVIVAFIMLYYVHGVKEWCCMLDSKCTCPFNQCVKTCKNGLKWFGPMVQNEFDDVRAMLVAPTSDILSVRYVRSEESKCFCSANVFSYCSRFFWHPFIPGLLRSICFC